MYRRTPWIALLAMLLSGCASIPAPLQGDIAQQPRPEAVGDAEVGQRFRWGGTLIEARPGERSTCLELLSRTLDRQFRPRPGDAAHGRFRACHDGFLDPEIFAAGRDVTVIGALEGFEDGQVGEFDYRFPVLRTTAVYLWPERVDFPDRYYYDPYWRYHGWPYWPYGGPYWIHRPVYGPVRVHRGGSAPAAAAQPAVPER